MKLDAIEASLEPHIDFAKPNKVINIYKGKFELTVNENESYTIDGIISFKWFPAPGAYFSGKIRISGKQLDKIIIEKQNLFISSQPLFKLDIWITKYTLSGKGPIKIEGKVKSKILTGDTTIPVQKIKFIIPNLVSITGRPIKRETKINCQFANNRIVLSNSKYNIILDQSFEYSKRQELVKHEGGYISLYQGELTSNKSNLSYKNHIDIFTQLNTFLSFINSKKTSALFLNASNDNTNIWNDFTPYPLFPFTADYTWLPWKSGNEIEAIWQEFSKLWQNETDKNFLTTIIHWYTEINNPLIFTESAIILTQTGLELIYNYLIVEKLKLILGKDAKSISAANKIRLVLRHLKIPTEVPIGFKALNEFVSAEKKDKSEDVIDAIVNIRNSIVHSQHEKRKKLALVPDLVKIQAQRLCRFYLEMGILYVLNYQGKYKDTCSWERPDLIKDKTVPWVYGK